jgi:hypothetical protein
MFRSFIKFASVVFLALFADPAFLWRLTVCLLIGATATVLCYWLWPAVLPVWPGALLILGSAIVGITWEWRASKSNETTIR